MKLIIFLALSMYALQSQANNLDAGLEAVFARDYQKAIELLIPLAQRGDIDAQYWLGISYRVGRPEKSTVDMENELLWYLKAAEANHPYALWRLGQGEYLECQMLGSCQHKKNELLEKAREEWRARADNGDGEAIYNLAIRGLGWKKWIPYYNISQRLKGLKQAIEYGYPRAAIELSLNLEELNRRNEAITWLKKAADQGSTEAQHRLGELAEDEQEQLFWTQKAAEKNHGDALYALGYIYKNGIGVEKDLRESAFYYCILTRDSGARDQCHILGKQLSSEDRQAVSDKVIEWLKHNQAYYPQHPLFY